MLRPLRWSSPDQKVAQEDHFFKGIKYTVGADVSVRVHGRATYHFTAWFAIRMGYAVIYERGRPDNRLVDELEVFLHGPLISFLFSTP